MNVRVNIPYVEVTLSRRNLESLLAKLDRPKLASGETRHTLTRMAGTDEGEKYVLTIVAEEDDAHYQGREAGDMGYDIEERLAANRSRRVQSVVDMIYGDSSSGFQD